MWPRDAYVGQRVVCVDDDWDNKSDTSEQPRIGKVYTIRAVCNHLKHISLRFVEVVRPPAQYTTGWHEGSFYAKRFKPVDESRLDVFREMLKRPGVWNRDENRKDVVRADAI